MPSDPKKYRVFHHLLPAFCPGWTFVDGETPSRPAPRRRCASSVDSIIGAQSPAADLATSPSIRCGKRRADGHEPLVAVPTPAISVSIGSIPKCRRETISYRETSITNACYLCNTHRKRGGVRPFEAVPLLRVQKSSVIVITRRRGASRGRPVLGGSVHRRYEDALILQRFFRGLKSAFVRQIVQSHNLEV